jgi:two-component system, OmpR family, response regulator ResD
MPITALVCDDDTSYRSVVRDILEGSGVRVVEARDGQEAMSVFMKEDIDLVVTDFLMPKVDGLQMIRNIRLSGDRGQVPVVLMSAISKSQILADHPELGPDHYINKPFKPKKMAKLLERVLHSLKSAE